MGRFFTPPAKSVDKVAQFVGTAIDEHALFGAARAFLIAGNTLESIATNACRTFVRSPELS